MPFAWAPFSAEFNALLNERGCVAVWRGPGVSSMFANTLSAAATSEDGGNSRCDTISYSIFCTLF
jgi:hypothetical protein